MGSNKYSSFIRNFITSVILYDFIFAYAIYTVFFSVQGLSTLEISLLLTFWAFSFAILEIPSGALADYWGYKNMIIISPLIKSLCFVCWFFANGNFYLFGLGFLFWTMWSVCMSWSRESLFYTNLVNFNKKESYIKILGKIEFYKQIAQTIAMLSGALLATYNLKIAIVLSIIPLILSSIFASFLYDVPKVKSTGKTTYLEYIKIAFKEISSSKTLIILFVCSLIFSIFESLNEFDQLYYQFVHLPIWAFGIMGAIWSGINATGSYFAHKFEKKYVIYYTIPILSGILLFLTGYSPDIWMIFAIMGSYLLASPLKILIESKIQHTISSKSRATITSVASFLINIVGALSFPVFWLLANKFGIPSIYLVCGLWLFGFSLWIFKVRKVFYTGTY